MTPEELKASLNNKIRERRMELKMTQSELAAAMGIKPASLSVMLNRTRSITLFNLHKLQKILDIQLLNL